MSNDDPYLGVAKKLKLLKLNPQSQIELEPSKTIRCQPHGDKEYTTQPIELGATEECDIPPRQSNGKRKAT